MELQSIFYVLGIIFMMLWIIILITIVYALWRLEKSVMGIKDKIEVAKDMFEEKKSEVMGAVGAGIVASILKKFRNRD